MSIAPGMSASHCGGSGNGTHFGSNVEMRLPASPFDYLQYMSKPAADAAVANYYELCGTFYGLIAGNVEYAHNSDISSDESSEGGSQLSVGSSRTRSRRARRRAAKRTATACQNFGYFCGVDSLSKMFLEQYRQFVQMVLEPGCSLYMLLSFPSDWYDWDSSELLSVRKCSRGHVHLCNTGHDLKQVLRSLTGYVQVGRAVQRGFSHIAYREFPEYSLDTWFDWGSAAELDLSTVPGFCYLKFVRKDCRYVVGYQLGPNPQVQDLLGLSQVYVMELSDMRSLYLDKADIWHVGGCGVAAIPALASISVGFPDASFGSWLIDAVSVPMVVGMNVTDRIGSSVNVAPTAPLVLACNRGVIEEPKVGYTTYSALNYGLLYVPADAKVRGPYWKVRPHNRSTIIFMRPGTSVQIQDGYGYEFQPEVGTQFRDLRWPLLADACMAIMYASPFEGNFGRSLRTSAAALDTMRSDVVEFDFEATVDEPVGFAIGDLFGESSVVIALSAAVGGSEQSCSCDLLLAGCVQITNTLENVVVGNVDRSQPIKFGTSSFTEYLFSVVRDGELR